MKRLEKNVPLAPLTTIQLGGPAQWVVRCTTEEDVRDALIVAREKNIPEHVLAGGSNTVFSDEGFRGLIIKIEIGGVVYENRDEHVLAHVGAGVTWDEFVLDTLQRGLGGLETMSGVPGSVGATPMQNVGAYGKDVSSTIVEVRALHKQSLAQVRFSAAECEFGYRTSMFKERERGKYVIVGVTFRLQSDGMPEVIYPDLVKELGGEEACATLGKGEEALLRVREAVLSVRRRKSMVLDENDPNTRSCGSFFLNTVLSPAEAATLQKRAKDLKLPEPPSFVDHDKIKVPTAWLVEHAGFVKGMQQNGVGISHNHPLALVNFGGTTTALLELVRQIQQGVKDKFKVELVPEPDIVE